TCKAASHTVRTGNGRQRTDRERTPSRRDCPPNPDGPDCSRSTVEAATGARPVQDRRAPACTPGGDGRREEKPTLGAPLNLETAQQGGRFIRGQGADFALSWSSVRPRRSRSR